MQYDGCGWLGTIETFLSVSRVSWLQALSVHHPRYSRGANPDQSQITAWTSCFDTMRGALEDVVSARFEAANWGLLFEYELPRERGRRPDVVVLTGTSVAVLEFKAHRTVFQAHVDQVSAYSRDLAEYHGRSHELDIRPILVLQGSLEHPKKLQDVTVVSPYSLRDELMSLPSAHLSAVDIESWATAPYAPLPALVAAARSIFRNEPLPRIRRAQSAGVEYAVRILSEVAREARAKGERHLALVTGAPGAGKTLVGLQFVYEDSIAETDTARSAVFLSGNAPLVKVLQNALKSKAFVQDVHAFLLQYGASGTGVPEEHIWVYDEAQRAWDAERVGKRRGRPISEPEDFLRLGDEVQGWAMLVGLIGEGQEIHLGEESGISQWDEALAAVGGSWTVHCPDSLRLVFRSAHEVRVNSGLALTESLRSHLASDVDDWINALLSGQLARAADIAAGMRAVHFDVYVTRDLDAAKAYVRERYAGEDDKRYGLITSSKARSLPEYGLTIGYRRFFDPGPWFNNEPTSPKSCCQLDDIITEFQCQGLELDCPVIYWSTDVTWDGSKWLSVAQPRSKAHDPHQLRLNSYRVLLSRGRDGFVVFIPPLKELDATYSALLQAGIRPLVASPLAMTA